MLTRIVNLKALASLLILFLLLGCATEQKQASSTLVPDVLAFWHPTKPKTLVVLATVANRAAFNQTVGLHDTWIEYDQIQNLDLDTRSLQPGHLSSQTAPVDPGDVWYPLLLRPGERAYLLYEFPDAAGAPETRGRSAQVTFWCESRPQSSWSKLRADPAWAESLQARCWRGQLSATAVVPPPLVSLIPGYAISATATNTPLGVWRKTSLYPATAAPQVGN